MAAHCQPGTLPQNYDEITKARASDGLYVLALAGKLLVDDGGHDYDEHDLLPPRRSPPYYNKRSDRSELESDLVFLGLLLFRNELRPCSPAAIKELGHGGIRSRIVTGDNVWTGLRVAGECGVVCGQRMMMCVGDVVDGVMAWEIELPKEGRESGGVLGPEIFEDVDFEEAVLGVKLSGDELVLEDEDEFCSTRTGPHGGRTASEAGRLESEPLLLGSRRTFTGRNSYFAENAFTADSEMFRGPAVRSIQKGCVLSSLQRRESKRTPLSALMFDAHRSSVPPSRGSSWSGQAETAPKPPSRLGSAVALPEPHAPEIIFRTEDAARPLSSLLEEHSSHLFFALTQKAYSQLQADSPLLFNKIFPRTLVFGRMTPTGKIDVVRTWQTDFDKIVGMCGDGGNDVGALGRAHVGVALSESDASLVAPFSSSKESVRCVVDIVKHSRAALHNAVGVFYFFALSCWIHMIYKLQIQFLKGVMPELFFWVKDLVLIPLLGCYSIASGAPDLAKPLSRNLASADPLHRSNIVFFLSFVALCGGSVLLLTKILDGTDLFGWRTWYRSNPDYAPLGLSAIAFVKRASHPLGAVGHSIRENHAQLVHCLDRGGRDNVRVGHDYPHRTGFSAHSQTSVRPVSPPPCTVHATVPLLPHAQSICHTCHVGCTLHSVILTEFRKAV